MSSTTTSSTAKKTPFLLTGVTGGLGAKILTTMLQVHHIPPSDIIATSRSASNASQFTSLGVQYRHADYKDLNSLVAAFANVRDVLFMSSSQRDNDVRNMEHGNVVAAAKKAGVGRVWYVSLAFGGWGDASKIGFQQAHYETENLLRASGLDFISLRAGVYSDAFPLFLNWYPSSPRILLPTVEPSVAESKIAFTTRSELGEGIAALLANGLAHYSASIVPRTDKNIILLTATETNSLVDIARAIPSRPEIEYVEPEEWICRSAEGDLGGKGKAWFEARLVFTQGVCEGDAEVMDPALEILLGRKPETGVQAVERFVREDPEYRWHQNHIDGKGL